MESKDDSIENRDSDSLKRGVRFVAHFMLFLITWGGYVLYYGNKRRRIESNVYVGWIYNVASR